MIFCKFGVDNFFGGPLPDLFKIRVLPPIFNGIMCNFVPCFPILISFSLKPRLIKVI